jgi:4-oxalocrotonate tautomerase family enzyme
MPMISVRILKGHSREKLDRLGEGITRLVSDTTSIPADNIWVVVEEVDAERWYVKGRSVAAMTGT